MKKNISVFALMIFLIILPLTLAATSKQTFQTGNATIVSGKTITLRYAESNMVIFEVDGFSSRIKLTTSFSNDTVVYSPNFTISGVFFNITDIIPSIGEVRAYITIAFTCGNNICEANEAGFCCKDCNCSSGYSCLDNQCIETNLNKCLNNSNCNDNNNCTLDLCTGIPRDCSHTTICIKENQTITENITENITQNNSLINNCTIGAAAIIENTSSYCSESGWRAKKADSLICKNDYECINSCINGKCSIKSAPVNKTAYIFIGTIALILMILFVVYKKIHKSSIAMKEIA